MAAKRQRGGSLEYIIKRKGVLPKPVSLSFKDEAEGDRYVAHLEKLLAAGIVPDEFRHAADAIITIGQAMRRYQDVVHITVDDVKLLAALDGEIGSKPLDLVNYQWAEQWVKGMQLSGAAPSTIRHKVGALARCFDWVARREDTMLAANPLRMLPKRYATTQGGRKDVERNRRLQDGEEARIMAILNREKPEGRERPLALLHADALKLMFTLSLETAMRMREIYTLTVDQVDIPNRTIFLDKTKNGDERIVPITSVAASALQSWIDGREGWLFPMLFDGDMSAGVLRNTTMRLSAQWARIFSAAKCDDLRYHDLRREAISRMFERTKMSEVKIAKISGHSSTKMLMRYTKLRGSDLADEMW